VQIIRQDRHTPRANCSLCFAVQRCAAAAAAARGIEGVEISVPLHHTVTPLPEGESYLGFILARGETPAAVEASLRAAHACLRFTIVPEIDRLG
jgi:hypothetical protein